MTPDPTTRDPAASLRACIDLAAKATPGEWEVRPILAGYQLNGYLIAGTDSVARTIPSDEAQEEADAEAIAAAVNFLRDAAPALLAEVERLREGARVSEIFQQLVVGEGAWERFQALTQRADAAEQVARDQADELRVLREYIAANDRLDAFLAHHGARTGESNG